MKNEGISRMIAQETCACPVAAEAGQQILELISGLEQVRATKKQRLAAAIIGSAVRPTDDLVDTGDIQSARSAASILQNAVRTRTTDDRLPASLNRVITIATDNTNESALSTLDDLLLAQVDSVRQRDRQTGIDEISRITRSKGELTMLLMARTVQPNLTERSSRLYESIGYLVQLVDDMTDRQQDSMNGIVTPGTINPIGTMQNIRMLYNSIASQLAEFPRAAASKMQKYIDSLVRGLQVQSPN